MADLDDLTVYEQLQKYQDATNNPFEFFKYVKILDSTTNQIIPFEMWPHLQHLIWAVYNKPLVIVLKAKQIGVSHTMANIALHWTYRTGANVLMISSGQDEAGDLLQKSRFTNEYLPKFLRQETDHDGMGLLSFKGSHSRIISLPSTRDAGIGQTGSLVICDENEFHEYAAENYAQVKPTVDAGAHMVVVSTVDKAKVDSHFKTLWREARAGRNNFYPIFMDCFSRPGRDEEWYTRTQKDYYLKWQFEANYPRTEEEALSPLTGRSVFPGEILYKMMEDTDKPLELRQGATSIYLRPKIGTHYIAGADIAEGRGGDYSVLWIEGQEGLQRELCAVIHSNHIAVDTFAFMSKELLEEYYNPHVIGGADAFGTTYLQYLVDLGYPKSKIYCSDKKGEKLGYQEIEKTQQRDILLLESAIRSGLRIRYKPAIQELFAIQWKDVKGISRAESAKGEHDDLISAMSKANFGFSQFRRGVDITPIRIYGPPARRTFVRT